jgi:hypothetical protein
VGNVVVPVGLSGLLIPNLAGNMPCLFVCLLVEAGGWWGKIGSKMPG